MPKMLAAIFAILVLSFSTFPLSTAIAGQSAIEQALGSEETLTKSDKELIELLNISRGSIDLKELTSFLDRVRNNTRLEAILQEAGRQGVRIHVTFHFLSGPGFVSINAEITDDDEIINHVRTSISVALEKRTTPKRT